MAKPIISITDFTSGMNTDLTKPSGFATMFCLDPNSNPGILSVSQKLTQTSDTAITKTIKWFEVYKPAAGTAELYAYDDTTAGAKLYRYTSSAWALVRTNTQSSDGQGLKAFQASLYYSARGFLGKLTGDPTNVANYTDNHKTLSATVDSTDYCPLEVLNGALYVGNGRYIGKLESDETTFTGAALTLQNGLVVSCMTIWNDRLVFATKSSNAFATDKIFIWDGVSDFPESIINVPKPGATAIINHNNKLRCFIGRKLYQYNGVEFLPIKQIPKIVDEHASVYPGAVELFDERMLFGTTHTGGGNGAPINAVWSFGNNSPEFPEALMIPFKASFATTTLVEIGAMKVFGTSNGRPVLYVAWHDTNGSDYGIDAIDYDNKYSSGAYLLTQAYEMPNQQFGDLVKGLAITFSKDMNTTQSNNKIVVKYRADTNISVTDDTTNFTTLGTIDNDTAQQNNQNKILYGIYAKVKRIQFRLEFTCTSNQAPEPVRIDIY